MLTPTNSLPAYTISDLDRVQNAKAALAGALVELEILIGPNQYKNVGGTLEQVAEYLGTILGTPGGAADGFSITQLPNGTWKPSDLLAAYLDAGGELYWMSLNSAGQRQQVSAGTSPTATPAANSQALISMAAGLLQP